jgi:Uma2 family endonuclease
MGFPSSAFGEERSMSAAIARTITAEEFARMPERKDGVHEELVRGVVVDIEPINKPLHGYTVTNIILPLGDYLHRNKIGRALCRCGAILFRNPDTVRAPDLLYYSLERMPVIPKDYYAGPPDLAIEVLSTDNNPDIIADKLHDYITSGVRTVWIVDRAEKSVVVYSGTLLGIEFYEYDILDGGAVLPGFTCPVAEFFS